MQAGQFRSSWQARGLRPIGATLALCALLASGCMTGERTAVEKNLMNDRHDAARHEGVLEQYRIACPDALEINIAQRPDWNGVYVIGPDGRIDLGDYGRLRIEGRTLAGAARLIAEELGVAESGVRLRITAFRSQHLLLFGEVIGWQRTVPYQGQETVLDVLQRVGGITPGAAIEKVYVVRPHLSDGQRPEVFHVDLEKIVVDRNDSTNLRVQPFDQIYVGATRQSRMEKAIPRWLKPIHQVFWDTRRSSASQEPPDSRPQPTRWVQGSERDAGVRLVGGEKKISRNNEP